MKALDFGSWLENINNLSRGQRDRVRFILEKHSNTDEVTSLLERALVDQLCCPDCSSIDLYRWGKSCGLQRYRCKQCNRTFNVLSHTPLAHLHHRDKWLVFEQAMIDGMSVRKAAVHCGIAKNNSFKWRHRFLSEPIQQQPPKMSGIVEADETFFLESFKGKRKLPRPARRRGGKAKKRGLSAEQIPVLVVRDRHGETADFVLQGTDTKSIEAVLSPLLGKDMILCSDGAASYRKIAQRAGAAHRPVNIAKGVRVVGGVYHIQNVNAYDSRLKSWMQRFHGVATRYLKSYLAWHRMLERFGKNVTPLGTMLSSLGKTGQFQQGFAT
ncbi:MAG: IS1595 family transposase [Ghiorsea sp.]|nr:IS1595 family transposase [Ghiorsea sp.]